MPPLAMGPPYTIIPLEMAHTFRVKYKREGFVDTSCKGR